MRKNPTPALFLLALSAGLAAQPGIAQETAAQPKITFESTELAPGLYMLEGAGGFAGGNLGLSIGDDGVVLIDDGLPPLTAELLAAVGELTDEPVGFVINTHVHGDHIGGNQTLSGEGATIVGHDRLRQRLVEEGIDLGGGPVPAPAGALPVLTFSDSITFHLNDRPAHVFHVANAHTDGDAVIHFREDDVIHAGDVFFNRVFPFIDLDSGGTVDGFLAAQKAILALCGEQTKIIPGHGPLASRDDLAAAIAMLEDARERVRSLVDAGRSREEILAAAPLADYHDDWNWGFITTERMTETLIRDLGDG